MTENIDAYAKCPKCKCDLEYIEQTDFDYNDMYYFVSWEGFCPQCQQTFVFVEDYKLVERRFLNEESNC